MLQIQDELMRAAREHLLERDIEHERDTDVGQEDVFKEHSYVMIKPTVDQYGTGKKNKFSILNKGPLEVLRKEGRMYHLRNLTNGRIVKVGQKRLAKYEVNSQDTAQTLLEAAMRDDERYIVERIVSRIGPMNNKRHLKFRVKWLGYDNITEEPWQNLRDTEAMHQYLREHGLEHEIPRKFR